MKSFTVSAVIGLLASTVAAQATAFTETCTNIALKGEYWLVADCPSGNGSEVITSAIFLSRWIEEPDSQITDQAFKWNSGVNWTPVGTFCRDCELAGSVLTCSCPEYQSGYVPYSIELSDHISNYAGHLLHDLTGTPTIPPPSTFPVPTTDREFSYLTQSHIGANCTGSYANFHGEGPPTTGDCIALKSGRTNYRTIGHAKQFDTDVVPRYELLVYRSSGCREETFLARLGEYEDRCRDFGGELGVRVVPKFNWA